MKLIDIHISNDKVFSTLNCNSKVVVVIGNFDGLHKGHQKLLNIENIRKIGWEPKISLKEGIIKTIKDFQREIFK